jgi:hypothetical protein
LDKPVIVGSVEDGHPGPWAGELASHGVGIGRGMRATARGLRTMRDFTIHRERPRSEPPAIVAHPPPSARPIDSEAGQILGFRATMELLTGAGITVAPHVVLEEGVSPNDLPFGPPYVVKLADVPHRSDIGAVHIGVAAGELESSMALLRAVAVSHGLPDRVVVQPLVGVEGEAFVGVKGDSELGSLVLCGVGGIFVEILAQVSGRLAPLDLRDAEEMLDGIAATGVFRGARGRRPWAREPLARLLVAVGSLAAGSRSWLQTLDINPLAWTGERYVALDGLCVLRDECVADPY